MPTSWQILRASVTTLRSRKELGLFPLLAGVSELIAIAAMLAVAAAVPAILDVQWLTVCALILAYFVIVYIVTFWQGALISQADVALAGGDPSVVGGLRAAGASAARLVPWAAVAGTVSWLLGRVEDRAPVIGRVLETGWKAISFQVLPIMIIERAGLPTAVGKSKDLIGSAIGKNVVGVVGLSIASVLLVIPGGAVVILGLNGPAGPTMWVIVGLGALLAAVGAVVASALTGIYQTALYRYLVDQQAPQAFAEVDMGQLLRTA